MLKFLWKGMEMQAQISVFQNRAYFHVTKKQRRGGAACSQEA
jgi:hypothetical protein